MPPPPRRLNILIPGRALTSNCNADDLGTMLKLGTLSISKASVTIEARVVPSLEISAKIRLTRLFGLPQICCVHPLTYLQLRRVF